MQTSDNGIEFIERHEGVVLKAYPDPVGIMTIGAGLTKASGVVTPKPGMVITRKEASRLLGLALRRNYEPRVAREMPLAEQHEFDAGVSFDFNTGAIHRASWVKHWRAGRYWAKVYPAIKAWRKAGGRVLPGLERRREEEYALLARGEYHPALRTGTILDGDWAGIVLPIEPEKIAEIARSLTELGYDAGATSRIKARAVRQFQEDHDLTVDGIIGRATLSTLQRRIDARRKAGQTAAGAAGAGGAASTQASPNPAVADLLPDWAVWAGLALVALITLRLAWSYRDVVAVKVQSRAPKLAAKLRSF